MNLFKQFGTNKEAEAHGVWVELGTNASGFPIAFLLARMGGSNLAYTKALEEELRPFRRAIAAGTMDNRKSQSILRRVFAKTVLLDWKGVEDADDQPLPYSPAAAIQILEDLPDLYTVLIERAQERETFQEAQLEDDLGNSGR